MYQPNRKGTTNDILDRKRFQEILAALGELVFEVFMP